MFVTLEFIMIVPFFFIHLTSVVFFAGELVMICRDIDVTFPVLTTFEQFVSSLLAGEVTAFQHGVFIGIIYFACPVTAVKVIMIIRVIHLS